MQPKLKKYVIIVLVKFKHKVKGEKMVKNTNLEYCKKIAIAFLHQPILPTDCFGIITHPVLESNFVVGMNEDGTQSNGLVDLLKDKKMLSRYIKYYENCINSQKDLYGILNFIRKPYILQFLNITKEQISCRDFSESLIEGWVSDEYANQNTSVSREELLNMFLMADAEYMIDNEDKKTYQTIKNSKEITIYRGVTEYNEKDVDKALSWTLDIDTALYFATRFNQHGNVYKAIIASDDVLAYTNIRNEQEVIVNPIGLNNIRKDNELSISKENVEPSIDM
jgi:hypothetical protein